MYILRATNQFKPINSWILFPSEPSEVVVFPDTIHSSLR